VRKYSHFTDPEGSLSKLERYSYFVTFRTMLIADKIAVARQLVTKC